MKKLITGLLLLASATLAHAQNLQGTWQGTLSIGPQNLRVVFKVAVGADDKYTATNYSLDQGGQPIPVGSVTKDGAVIKMTIPAVNGIYEGRLSPDGNTITGTFSQGAPVPLTLTRATPGNEWPIPEALPPPKPMPADAKPVFEVSTIKPAAPGPGWGIGINRSGLLNTRNTSLLDLIKFAYNLHGKQVTGGPGWLEEDKYDITAKPDIAGVPSVAQFKMMAQGLIAERFHLVFHMEKKELAAYSITVTKAGAKLEKNDSNPNGLPGFGGGGPQGMNVRNATLAEFATVLQAGILDKPVVDQTGFANQRYNFVLKWTPDAAMAAGMGMPPTAAAADNPDAPPDIFAAFQQQLGLKLDSVKTQVDVMVIDKVERPSEN